MLTLAPERAEQLALDIAIDTERHERQDWQRALDRNLHALEDYVMPHQQALVWQPGTRQQGRGDKGFRAFDVQIVTSSSCTCSRFKLRDRCEHVAFITRLEVEGITLGQDVPVRAVDIEENEVAA